MTNDEQAMEWVKNLRNYCSVTGCLYCCFNGQHSCRIHEMITSGRHRRIFGSKNKYVNIEALREKLRDVRLIETTDPDAVIQSILDKMED